MEKSGWRGFLAAIRGWDEDAAGRKTISYFWLYAITAAILVIAMPSIIGSIPSNSANVVGNVKFYILRKEGEAFFFFLTFAVFIAIAYIAQKKKWVVVGDG